MARCMLNLDFTNAFNLLHTRNRPSTTLCHKMVQRDCYQCGIQQGDPLRPFLLFPCPVYLLDTITYIKLQMWYLDDGTIIRYTIYYTIYVEYSLNSDLSHY